MMKTMIKAMDGVNRLGLKYQTRMPSLSGRMGLKVPKTRFYLAVRCGSTAPENDMERIRVRSRVHPYAYDSIQDNKK